MNEIYDEILEKLDTFCIKYNENHILLELDK